MRQMSSPPDQDGNPEMEEGHSRCQYPLNRDWWFLQRINPFGFALIAGYTLTFTAQEI